jgi:hypothetical protein
MTMQGEWTPGGRSHAPQLDLFELYYLKWHNLTDSSANGFSNVENISS